MVRKIVLYQTKKGKIFQNYKDASESEHLCKQERKISKVLELVRSYRDIKNSFSTNTFIDLINKGHIKINDSILDL